MEHQQNADILTACESFHVSQTSGHVLDAEVPAEEKKRKKTKNVNETF